MSKDDARAIWNEINSLREDVDELKVIKERVSGSMLELQGLTTEMKTRLKRMDEVISELKTITVSDN